MSDEPRAMGLRAGTPAFVQAVMTTDRAVAVLVLGALGAMILLRRGFRGALGD